MLVATCIHTAACFKFPPPVHVKPHAAEWQAEWQADDHIMILIQRWPGADILGAAHLLQVMAGSLPP